MLSVTAPGLRKPLFVPFTVFTGSTYWALGLTVLGLGFVFRVLGLMALRIQGSGAELVQDYGRDVTAAFPARQFRFKTTFC